MSHLPTLNCITSIVLGGPHIKMLRIETRRVITVMQDFE
jgi:hypothetical protein